jgi:hypothetical protein
MNAEMAVTMLAKRNRMMEMANRADVHLHGPGAGSGKDKKQMERRFCLLFGSFIFPLEVEIDELRILL